LLLSVALSPSAGSVVGWGFEHLTLLLPLEQILLTAKTVAFNHPHPTWARHVLIVPRKQLRTVSYFLMNQSYLGNVYRFPQKNANVIHPLAELRQVVRRFCARSGLCMICDRIKASSSRLPAVNQHTTLKAFKYKLQPTKTQAKQLDSTLYLCRQLYNAALQERLGAYTKCNVSVTRFQQDKSLPEIKQALPEYNAVHSQVLQDVLKRLDKTYQAFFRRVKLGQTPGFPRFKGRNRFDSFCYPQYKTAPKACPEQGRRNKHVYLPKIGNVRLRLSRPVEGKVKTATVKREADGWYVVLVCEVDKQPLPATLNAIGIDLGLTDILATSEGELIAAPKYFSKAQKALAKAQRRLARRKKGSKRREEARVQVAKLHQKVARQRGDFLHKLSHRLVKENDVIVHEKLNIVGLAKGMLAKSVHDVSWAKLIDMLTYKAENAGRQIVSVSPNYTSQDCNVCGHREKHPLWVREFICKGCGVKHHRDLNAALNIKNKHVLSNIEGWVRSEPLDVNVVALGTSVVQESHVF
jgi:putative transposase